MEPLFFLLTEDEIKAAEELILKTECSPAKAPLEIKDSSDSSQSDLSEMKTAS